MSKADDPPAYDDVLTAKEFEANKHFYEDKFVKITREGIEIKCYYFPTTQNKFIPFSAIKTVYYDAQGCLKKCCYIKSWGMAFSNVWWACDMRRQCPIGDKSNYNVILDVGESPMKGFTVSDISSFLSVLKSHLPDIPTKPELPF
ncbi:unnamed protein product, partial [Mesorhabditis belari]|uniref:Uncharacterized protein n=1 Tax=Mesorhabditis belari TaxID=2138241 RepID=A0AAF3ESD8_9BILA